MEMSSSKIFSDKNILITGGSRGLGFSVAVDLLLKGANIAICGRSKVEVKEAEKTLRSLKNKDQKILALQLDISRSKNVHELYENTKYVFDSINIVINNAGVVEPVQKFIDCDLDLWAKAVDINLLGSVRVIHKFLPDMINVGKGKIIQISGGGASKAMKGMTAYAASKVAVVRFIETLSLEYKDSGVDFNSVAPGILNTKMLKNLINSGSDIIGHDLYEKYLEKINETGDSTLNAQNLISFLCSGLSDGISGRLISAEWDDWAVWPKHLDELRNSDSYTLRRIINRDRNQQWGDK
jgi:NAD(P)-dependent dehydrogenase (short-subunit alcohol dehydrogenase family)